MSQCWLKIGQASVRYAISGNSFSAYMCSLNSVCIVFQGRNSFLTSFKQAVIILLQQQQSLNNSEKLSQNACNYNGEVILEGISIEHIIAPYILAILLKETSLIPQIYFSCTYTLLFRQITVGSAVMAH